MLSVMLLICYERFVLMSGFIVKPRTLPEETRIRKIRRVCFRASLGC